MTTLLIVAHQPSSNTERIAHAIVEGAASNEDNDQLSIISKTPFETTASDILLCDGIVLFTTENFGYMSGAQKDLFDRVYYSVLEQKRGLPCALIIRAGKDGTGAKRSTESILKGLGWKLVSDPLILQGEFQESFLQDAKLLAETFSTGLSCGIY